MKVAINKCYGGFNLSPLAIKEIAKRKGKECYFFYYNLSDKTYTPLTLEQATEKFFCSVYSVPNPQDYNLDTLDQDGSYKSANARANEIKIDSRPDDRTDPDLIAVIEKLGKLASGPCAKLEIIDIPDGTDYEIMEYDGLEHIAEKHKTWG